MGIGTKPVVVAETLDIVTDATENHNCVGIWGSRVVPYRLRGVQGLPSRSCGLASHVMQLPASRFKVSGHTYLVPQVAFSAGTKTNLYKYYLSIYLSPQVAVLMRLRVPGTGTVV